MVEKIEVPKAELEALIEAADNLQMAVGAAAFRTTTKGILMQAYDRYMHARVAFGSPAHYDRSQPQENEA